jgi:hypothetical protein
VLMYFLMIYKLEKDKDFILTEYKTLPL